MNPLTTIDLDHTGPASSGHLPLHRLILGRLILGQLGPDRPGRGRWGVASGLAVSVLLALSVGAAAPHWPAIAAEFEQPTEPGSAQLVGGDTLFVATARAEGAELTAYRHGHLSWRAEVPDDAAGFASLGYGTGVVVMTVYDEPDHSPHTTAYDATSGRPLWRGPVAAEQSISDGVALARRPLPDPDLPGSFGRFEIAAMDRRTGGILWRQEINQSHDDRWATGDDDRTGRLHWFVVLAGDGRLTVRDTRTGHLTASRTGVPGEGFRSLTVHNGLVVIHRGGTILEAYELSTLELRWRQTVLPAEEGIDGCGPYLCLRSPGLLTAIDPHTGTPAWRLIGAQWAGDEVDGYFVGAWPSGTYRILSAATGRVVIDLRDWVPATLTAAHSPVLLASRRQPVVPAQTRFALIHLDTGSIELIGQVAGDWYACELIELNGTGGRLSCQHPPDGSEPRLVGWRFRRP